MNDWHYQHNGETKGPVDDRQMKALADAGVVNSGTPVWKTGYQNWIPLSHSDFQYLADVPPPPVAGAGGAALAGAAGSFQGAYQVDDRGMWQMFTDAITKNYVTFTGRARRKEFWSFVLFYIVFFILAVGIGVGIDFGVGNIDPHMGERPMPIATGAFAVITYLAFLLPGIAITVRRLHDIGLSGWLILVSFIPYVGGLALLVMMLIPTQFGPNKHGPAPKRPPSG